MTDLGMPKTTQEDSDSAPVLANRLRAPAAYLSPFRRESRLRRSPTHVFEFPFRSFSAIYGE